jgi:hypothetical protein
MTPRGHDWHPWRHLADHHPDIEVCWHDLPPDTLGYTDGATVVLANGLTQAERRCTLTHELGHVHRGPLPADPWLAAREHAAIDREAARLLVELHALADALRWSDDADEVADELWVDVPTLRARLADLTAHEADVLNRALAERWHP